MLKHLLRPVLRQFQQFLHICLCFADNLVRSLCRPLCASHLQQPLKDRSEISRYFKASAANSNFCVQILYCICTVIAFPKLSCCDSLRLYWSFLESVSLCPSIFCSDSGPSYHLLSQPTSFENGAPLATGSSSFCSFPTSISRSSFCNSRSLVCSYGLERGSDRWCLITMPICCLDQWRVSPIVLACAP